MAYGTHDTNPGETVPQPMFRVLLSDVQAEGNDPADGEVTLPGWGAEYHADALIPMSMTWSASGRPTTLTLRYLLGGNADVAEDRTEDIMHARYHGCRVRLVETRVDDETGEETPVEWFAGIVGMDSLKIQGSPQDEHYQLVAYGPELRLGAKVVTGQWWADDDSVKATIANGGNLSQREDTFATDLPVVFNAGGLPNMASQNSELVENAQWIAAGEGYEARVFVPGDYRPMWNGVVNLQAEHWTAYRAVRSLVEWFDNYDVIASGPTDWDAIHDVLGDVEIGEVDVEGLPLTDALARVLNPIGYGYCLVPWSATSEPWKHELFVYSLKDPALRLKPYLAAFGSNIRSDEGRRGEVQRLHFSGDSHHIRNSVTVYGDPEQVQVALEFHDGDGADPDLHPYWSTFDYPLTTYLTDGVFDIRNISAANRETLIDRYHPDGKEHSQYRHIWRSFCWNEDGQSSENIRLSQGGTPELPDLSGYEIGDSDGNYAIRPRPVHATLTYDDSALSIETIPAKVTLIADGVDYDPVQVEIPVSIWPDRAGFTIERPLFTIGKSSTGAKAGKIDYWRPFKDVAFPDTVNAATQKALKEISYLTLLNNTLTQTGQTMRLVLSGSIDDDKYVKGEAKRETGSSWPIVSQAVVRAPGRFRKYVVGDDITGTERELDESAAALALAQRVRDWGEDMVGHCSIMLRHLSRAFYPGFGVPATQGRVVDLTVDGGDGAVCPVVRSVKFTFGNTRTTELVLDSPLLKVTR